MTNCKYFKKDSVNLSLLFVFILVFSARGTKRNLPSRVALSGLGTARSKGRGKKSTSRKKSRSLARRGLSVSLGGVSACVRSCVLACVRVRGLSRVRRENSFSGPHETIKSRRRGGRSSTREPLSLSVPLLSFSVYFSSSPFFPFFLFSSFSPSLGLTFLFPLDRFPYYAKRYTNLNGFAWLLIKTFLAERFVNEDVPSRDRSLSRGCP